MSTFEIIKAIIDHPSTKEGDAVSFSSDFYDAVEKDLSREMEGGVSYSVFENKEKEQKTVITVQWKGKILHIIKQK